MMHLKSILFFLSVIVLGACASQDKKADCQNRDWYEVGRSTGAKGSGASEPQKLASYCEFTENSNSYQLYMQGYNAGLAEYCNPENAFYMGRTNRSYQAGLCPSFLEADFMAALKRGQRVAQLENENQALEQKMQELSHNSRTPANVKAKKQLKTLKQVHNQNKAKIRQLVN